MMRITQVPNGKWTVLRDSDNAVMCHVQTEGGTRAPKYFDTRGAVKAICIEAGWYEVKEGNPDNLPAGTLVQFVIGRP